MARVQVLSDHRGELGWGDFVEGIAFFFVCVGERDAAWVVVRHGGFDDVVEEVVHCAVLCLWTVSGWKCKIASSERYSPSSWSSQTTSGNANSLC